MTKIPVPFGCISKQSDDEEEKPKMKEAVDKREEIRCCCRLTFRNAETLQRHLLTHSITVVDPGVGKEVLREMRLSEENDNQGPKMREGDTFRMTFAIVCQDVWRPNVIERKTIRLPFEGRFWSNGMFHALSNRRNSCEPVDAQLLDVGILFEGPVIFGIAASTDVALCASDLFTDLFTLHAFDMFSKSSNLFFYYATDDCTKYNQVESVRRARFLGEVKVEHLEEFIENHQELECLTLNEKRGKCPVGYESHIESMIENWLNGRYSDNLKVVYIACNELFPEFGLLDKFEYMYWDEVEMPEKYECDEVMQYQFSLDPEAFECEEAAFIQRELDGKTASVRYEPHYFVFYV